MLEEHNDRPLLAINLLVLHKDDHSFGIHGLACESDNNFGIGNNFKAVKITSEKLQVTKPPQKSLHHTVDVLLEALDLVSLVVGLEVGDHPLHVVLQVVHVVGLLPEPGLHEPVVEDQVHSGLGRLLRALGSLLSAGVGADVEIITNFTGDVLENS